MSFSLNYVWIQAQRLDVPEQGDLISCPVPERLWDNVVDTANNYPDAEVSVWVDLYGVGNNTPRILRALNQKSPAPNIVFKSLDDVPEHQSDPLFKKPFDGFEDADGGNITTFWQQHDLARLYVVRHCLDNGEGVVIYSDMDMNLSKTSMTISKALNTISEHGVAVGLPSPYCQVDNQFFGFDSKAVRFLEESVIPKAEDATAHGLLGWDGFAAAFHAEATDYIDTLRFAPLLNVGATQIPDSEVIKKSYQTLTA